MPELPEVETVVRGLRAVLPGRRILNVRLGKTDFIDDPAALELQLPGSRIVAVRRHGKFILVELESANGRKHESSFLIHLGMTGQIVTCPPEVPVAPHTHVFLALDDGRELRYTDIRRFGRMAMLANTAHESVLGKLGLDPLEMSEEAFRTKIRSRRAHIKALLLDQRVLRGMGNIYTDESLWRARIHPRRLGSNLNDQEEMRSLWDADPPHHRGRPQQLFLSALPARSANSFKKSSKTRRSARSPSKEINQQRSSQSEKSGIKKACVGAHT